LLFYRTLTSDKKNSDFDGEATEIAQSIFRGLRGKSAGFPGRSTGEHCQRGVGPGYHDRIAAAIGVVANGKAGLLNNPGGNLIWMEAGVHARSTVRTI